MSGLTEAELDVAYDAVWSAILGDPSLERARSRLSIHELRQMIRHVAAAFILRAPASEREERHDRKTIEEITAILAPPDVMLVEASLADKQRRLFNLTIRRPLCITPAGRAALDAAGGGG